MNTRRKKLTANSNARRSVATEGEPSPEQSGRLERIRSIISVLLDLGRLIDKGAAYWVALAAIIVPRLA